MNTEDKRVDTEKDYSPNDEFFKNLKINVVKF